MIPSVVQKPVGGVEFVKVCEGLKVLGGDRWPCVQGGAEDFSKFEPIPTDGAVWARIVVSVLPCTLDAPLIWTRVMRVLVT